eukprot:CAMPEP_0194279360 /NCGR_PEP_ID=MMETSP0169-20130528/13881_1 /TAXON_ID=218684 /ORGANISM="Corethron pennatum, Strain L29A3" /LENGTH=357 /DNA_ID=CAMNT_0039023769 /DNA_START=66 /DNA_END=1139 /DNA_ORIENTATION=-
MKAYLVCVFFYSALPAYAAVETKRLRKSVSVPKPLNGNGSIRRKAAEQNVDYIKVGKEDDYFMKYRVLKNSYKTDSPTNFPTEAADDSTDKPCGMNDADREEGIRRVIELVSPQSSDEDSAQAKALAWIISEDGLFLCPDSPNIIQRYAVATIAYATDYENWNDSGNILSSENECEWEGTVVDSFKINCNRQNVVTNLDIDENNAGGFLPAEIGLLTGLSVINMDDNQIGGSIPPSIGDLSRLRVLDLDSNRLTGVLPTELFLLPLETLDLNTNSLEGTIPSEVGNLNSVTFVQLNENAFTGTLPSELENLVNLDIFTFNENEITGTLPEGLCDIVEQEKLVATCDKNFECSCCTCV